MRVYIVDSFAPRLLQLLLLGEYKSKRRIFDLLHRLFEAPGNATVYLIKTMS
jgi:hypothetical protein